MSTEKIREVLDWVDNYLGNYPAAQDARRAALAELEALERQDTATWNAAIEAAAEDADDVACHQCTGIGDRLRALKREAK